MAKSKPGDLMHEERRNSSILDWDDSNRASLGEEAGSGLGGKLMRGEYVELAEDGEVADRALRPSGHQTLKAPVKSQLLQETRDAVEGDRPDDVDASAEPGAPLSTVEQLRQARKEKRRAWAQAASGEAAADATSGAVKANANATAASSASGEALASSGAALKAATKAKAAKAPATAAAGKLAHAAAYGRQAAARAASRATGGHGAARAASSAPAATAAPATAGAGSVGALAALAPVIVAVIAACALVAVIVALIGGQESQQAGGDGAERIVAIAKAEFESGERDGTYHSGGEKYWRWVGKESRVEWCCCFVSWCADQCGFVESGLFTKTASCAVEYTWLSTGGRGKSHSEPGYVPKKGDIAFTGVAGQDHIAIVAECDGTMFWTYEGNSPDRVSHWSYPVGTNAFNHYVTPAYPNSGGGALMEGVDFSIGEKKFVKEWANRIDTFFRGYQPTSPLIGHGKAFAQAAWDAHFDPRFLPAVACKESSALHTPDYAPYNYYGWGVTDSGPVSEAYSDGIDSLIHHIIVEGVLGGKPLREYTSIDEISHAPWSGDPEPWSAEVKQFMARI